MRRFGKASTIFEDVETLEVVGDRGGPIISAHDNNGILRDHDFTDLVAGGSMNIGKEGEKDRKTITLQGREDLFDEIRPALLARMSGKAQKSQQLYARQIRFLWAFLEKHDDAWHEPVTSVAQIDSVFGVVFRQWILELPYPSLRPAFPFCRSIINAARGLMELPKIAWPAIADPEPTRVHEDVSPEAIRAVRHACVKHLSHRSRLQLLGVDPLESDISLNASKAKDRSMSLTYLAALRRSRMRACIVFGETKEPKAHLLSDPRYSRPRRDHYDFTFKDDATHQYDLLSAPGIVETGARMLLVIAETGWVDAVRGIDISGQWCIEDDHDGGKNRAVAVLTRRLKTKTPLTHISTRTSSSPFGAITRQIERTAYLRELLIERRERLLNGEVPLAGRERDAELHDIGQKLKSPWIYFSTGSLQPGAACVGMMDADGVHYALDRLREEMFDPGRPKKYTEEQRAEIELLSPSDLRDGFAERVYRSSGGNIFAVKAALGHRNVNSTTRYLRQRKQLNARFSAFRAVTGVALSEVGDGHEIDPAVLRARCFTGEDVGISEDDRRRLMATRTRMGMGCAAPTEPPPELAPGHEAGTLCSVQRCVLCKHGIFFKDAPGAMEAMATRHGELLEIRHATHVDRFWESSFRIELLAIEAVLRDFYGDRTSEFMEISTQVARDVRAGVRPLFAQAPVPTGGKEGEAAK